MSEQKVLIILEKHEEIAKEGLEILKNHHIQYTIIKNTKSIEKHNRYKALLVRGAIIDDELIDSLPHLGIIARGGVGVDNIDIEYATKKNIYVCNVPDANFYSVAEHVIGLIISLSHQIVRANQALSHGDFNVRHLYIGNELKGKTIGIIGYGKIGELVAKKCINGLEMNVLVYDPYINAENKEGITFLENIDQLLIHSDFISLHLPFIPKLHHFINKDLISKMKNTAYLINCARGGLVDEQALATAIKRGELAGAGIDVFENEPPKIDNPLLNLETVIVTPHTAASTEESLALMATGAAREIVRLFNNETPINHVNLQEK